MSSLSKGEMLRRVQTVIPKLREEHLVARGFAGIRSNVVEPAGTMAKVNSNEAATNKPA